MSPCIGGLTLEPGTRKPFGDIFQDWNNIYEESTSNQDLSSKLHRFFRRLDIKIVI
jgi:hypothetical protein